MNQSLFVNRRALTAASLLILLLASVAFVPQVNAAAQAVIRQIGQFVLVDRAPVEENIPAEDLAALPTAEPPAFSPITALDLQEASQVAGFKGLEPAALPDGFSLVHRVVQAVPDGISLYSVYQNAGDLLTLAQVSYEAGSDPQEFWTGGTQLTEVTVSGQPGMWIQDVQMGIPSTEDGQTEVYQMDLLMWEQDGFTFWMATNHLSYEQVSAAAESLH